MTSTTPDAPQVGQVPRKVVIGLVVGWFLIAIKCVLAPWVMARWQVPVDPGWVILPTLFLAAIATTMILAHDWSAPDD